MNRYRMQAAPQWWEPRLRPRLVRMLRGLRRRKRLADQQLVSVDVRGAEHMREALARGEGVLITPNHPTHADPYTLYEAADTAGTPLYIMAAWQVFDAQGRWGQRMLQWHGCFSVDREAADLRAFKQAVEILQSHPYPLVLFPEGEVYHTNDRVTPFREGASVIALSAAKRADRPMVCIPCALRYRYVEDPTPQLLSLMDRLEERILWRPRTQVPIVERIYDFAEAVLALKEMEYLGRTSDGTLPERSARLSTAVLEPLERHYGLIPKDTFVPERVKELRRQVIDRSAKATAPDEQQTLREQLDDLFLVVQLFSYPGDYVVEDPTVERIAETLDKFEEDVLGLFSATVRSRRSACVVFGNPVPVEGSRKAGARQLTETLEQRVQQLLDELRCEAGSAARGEIVTAL